MERRKFVIGLGSLAAGGAAATGTGAFTTQANRTVSVETTTDASGYLGLEGLNDDFVVDDGDVNNGNGVLEIELDKINPNSVTAITDVFRISNNSGDKVEVWGDPKGPHSSQVLFPFGGVNNDSKHWLRQDVPPELDYVEVLNSASENGVVDYNNGDIPVGFAKGVAKEIPSGESKTVSMIVDTRPDDVSVNDQLLNSIKIFANEV